MKKTDIIVDKHRSTTNSNKLVLWKNKASLRQAGIYTYGENRNKLWAIYLDLPQVK